MVAEGTILVELESGSPNQVHLVMYERSWAICTVSILGVLACYFSQYIVCGSCMQCRNKNYPRSRCSDVFVHLTLICYSSHKHDCEDDPFSRIVILKTYFCYLASIFVVFLKHGIYKGAAVWFRPYRSEVPP